MHPDAIGEAASHSPLILEYMLNEQLYPNYIYLTQKLICNTLQNADVHLIHKNILIIVKYLRSMKDKVSINEYKKWITNIFYRVMMNGTMDGYFKMFKEMIEILLNSDHWECFITGKIIDKRLLVNLKQSINNPTNPVDICDDRWCILLETMIDSFGDKTSLKKYDNDVGSVDESDVKTNDVSNENECDAIKLIQLLKNEEYKQFNQTIDQYKELKQENIIKTVEFNGQLCYVFCMLSFVYLFGFLDLQEK